MNGRMFAGPMQTTAGLTDKAGFYIFPEFRLARVAFERHLAINRNDDAWNQILPADCSCNGFQDRIAEGVVLLLHHSVYLNDFTWIVAAAGDRPPAAGGRPPAILPEVFRPSADLVDAGGRP